MERNLREDQVTFTAVDVAVWMRSRITVHDPLYQSEAVYTIQEKFGDHFTFDNANGNLAISREVLSEFRRLTDTTVVWDATERAWRLREEDDAPGRKAT